METWQFDDGTFCMLSTGDGLGDERVTYHELSEARTVPGNPGAVVPGPTAVTVKIYSPAEGKPPSAYFGDHQEIPFAVLHHFMDLVAARLQDR